MVVTVPQRTGARDGRYCAYMQSRSPFLFSAQCNQCADLLPAARRACGRATVPLNCACHTPAALIDEALSLFSSLCPGYFTTLSPSILARD
jgi:hypothetical protein